METIDIRPAATLGELEQAYDLWASVFPENRSFFQLRLDHDSAYRLETTWIAMVDGTIASSVQIFPYEMRWGTVALKVGGIGNVATLPEYRSRGLAQRLLRRQSEYMASQGYDLSLLFTDKYSFYEQIGWRSIADSLLATDASSLKGDGVAAQQETYRIRRYEETSDLAQVSRMYEQFADGMTGPMLRTLDYWRGQSAWRAVPPEKFLVAESGGELAAYLRYKLTKTGDLHIADCCYLPGRGEAAGLLLQAALQAESEAAKVTAHLPEGHFLHDGLLRRGASVETDMSKMWKPFRLADTLGKMAPELARRIRSAGAAGGSPQLPVQLLLTVGNEEAVVCIREDGAEVLPAAQSVRYNVAITLSDSEWVTLLLKGCDALKRQLPAGSEYVRALFPRQTYVFWPVDHF
ncbi:hypothetical protein SD70_21640 [Gordoniibacillus kamchatkensis]|uniref:N-acetyltransferase domain-containing protein n=1 Tax=Gordoniibacillus kamchatkensis TaxID=1590651 RepID=A0ABR5AEB0_9BACL|nr:GNAT family N-acetyltransferase [Paenibacillus sp. VKM B-2647]KIL39158.1 hypothetical protein SD70_21640 [Paenibacillus sp. VKM B-2647]